MAKGHWDREIEVTIGDRGREEKNEEMEVGRGRLDVINLFSHSFVLIFI